MLPSGGCLFLSAHDPRISGSDEKNDHLHFFFHSLFLTLILLRVSPDFNPVTLWFDDSLGLTGQHIVALVAIIL